MPLPFIIAGLSSIGTAIGGAAAAAGATAAAVGAAAAATAVGAGYFAVGLAATVASAASANALPLLVIGAGGAIVHAAGENDGYQKGKKAGYNEASVEYEAKMKQQAESFKTEKDKFLAAARVSKEQKDALIHVCILYIKDLEDENARLKAQNRRLSSEKQEWLNIYRSMKSELVAA